MSSVSISADGNGRFGDIPAPASASRQVIEWIDRLALAPHFEVQRIAARAARAHLRDDVTGSDTLAFLHEPLAVVPVRGQPGRIVLDDDEFAVADQAVAAVDHGAGRRGTHRITGLPGDVDALAYRIAGRERADQ